MSNFADFLSDFKQNAKRPAPQSQSALTKRTKYSGESAADENFPPTDLAELSVEINFLCIGAQKAGTTWLYEILKKTEEIGVPQQKEVHFWDWNRRKGLGWYSRQFPSDKEVIGEITPDYMVLPDRDIKEIHHMFPKLRIIFIARDLVDRAWSAMTMELRNQARGLRAGEFDIPYEEMDATTRMQLERDSDPGNYDDNFFMNRLKQPTHTERSDYASGLKRWLKYFPREQILILDYKEIAVDPERLLHKVLRHVQVKETALNSINVQDLKKRINAGLTSGQKLRPSLRTKMKGYLHPFESSFATLKQQWTSKGST